MNIPSCLAAPRHVEALADCDFYHVTDLPGCGTTHGVWDLRGREDEYLGGVSFREKRVLELGPASGHLSWHMERSGGAVVGFDLSPDGAWDLVPYAGLPVAAYGASVMDHIRRVQNGWWFARRVLGSSAEVAYGNIYAIPAELGAFDVATFGAILLHLRDPFQALASALRLTRETVIVTEVHPTQPAGSAMGSAAPAPDAPAPHPGTMYFLPDPEATDPGAGATWWCFPPQVICRFLAVLGFKDTRVTEHTQLYQGKPARMFTVVGRRTAGTVPG